jgi:hypothetical protein
LDLQEYSQRYKKIIKWGVISIVVVAAIIIYKKFNPSNVNYFPKCPFLSLTGLKCPGCGSQRAIHSILNLDIYAAIKHNFLLVPAIPYIILGAYFDTLKRPSERQVKLRKRLFGTKAIMIILTIIVVFWIYRNVILFIP